MHMAPRINFQDAADSVLLPVERLDRSSSKTGLPDSRRYSECHLVHIYQIRLGVSLTLRVIAANDLLIETIREPNVLHNPTNVHSVSELRLISG